ncbi:Rid family hydrolase [Streptomyces sp. NPDC001312]|uniref:Rid family hydrolase n=1 Tax=Streptomyces sp. NPDC001312 TaxID=3364561 RepID=UPI0036873432
MTTSHHSQSHAPSHAPPHSGGHRRLRRTLVALGAAVVLVGGVGGASAIADQNGRHRAITTPDAPAAIGPYSQGISAGNLTFVSGQLPIDPKTGSLPADASIEEQTRQALRSVEAVLKADGMWALPLDRGHPDHWIVKIHRTGVPVGDVEVLA